MNALTQAEFELPGLNGTLFHPAVSPLVNPALLRAFGDHVSDIPAMQFNARGAAINREWLTSAVDKRIVSEYPYWILSDATCVEPVSGCTVDLRPLVTMRDVSDMVIEGYGDETEAFLRNAAAMNWLAAFRIDDFYPVGADGIRHERSIFRFSFLDHVRSGAGHDMSYRHLVWAPVRLFLDYGDDAYIFLLASASKPGDLMEQVLGRPLVRASAGMRKAIEYMYLEPDRSRLVHGALSVRKLGQGSPRLGGIRDFIDICLQCWRTRDLVNMSAREFLALPLSPGPFDVHLARGHLALPRPS